MAGALRRWRAENGRRPKPKQERRAGSGDGERAHSALFSLLYAEIPRSVLVAPSPFPRLSATKSVPTGGADQGGGTPLLCTARAGAECVRVRAVRERARGSPSARAWLGCIWETRRRWWRRGVAAASALTRPAAAVDNTCYIGGSVAVVFSAFLL